MSSKHLLYSILFILLFIILFILGLTHKGITITLNYRIYPRRARLNKIPRKGPYFAWGYYIDKKPLIQIKKHKRNKKLAFFIFSENDNMTTAGNRWRGKEQHWSPNGPAIEVNGKEINVPIQFPKGYCFEFPHLKENNVFMLNKENELIKLPYMLNKEKFKIIDKTVMRNSDCINYKEKIIEILKQP